MWKAVLLNGYPLGLPPPLPQQPKFPTSPLATKAASVYVEDRCACRELGSLPHQRAIP